MMGFHLLIYWKKYFGAPVKGATFSPLTFIMSTSAEIDSVIKIDINLATGGFKCVNALPLLS